MPTTSARLRRDLLALAAAAAFMVAPVDVTSAEGRGATGQSPGSNAPQASSRGPGDTPISVTPVVEDDDLPPLETFLEHVKARLRSDDRLLNDYTFTQTVTARERDKKGAVKKTTVKVFEVFPGEEIGYERLVSENGKPTPALVLAREDEKHRKKVEEFVRERQRESPAARDKRLTKERKERDEEQQQIDELFRIMDGRLTGREYLGSQQTLVLAFSPRRKVKTTTTTGKVFKSIEGRAWFTADEHQLVKVEMRVIDTISFGLGLFARLHKDTTAKFERRLVAPDAWLPARYQFRGSGRIMLLKGVRVDTEVEFSDYRKSTAHTSETFGDPR